MEILWQKELCGLYDSARFRCDPLCLVERLLPRHIFVCGAICECLGGNTVGTAKTREREVESIGRRIWAMFPPPEQDEDLRVVY